MKVAALAVYPLKGGRGRTLETSSVGPGGLAEDRRWMLADENGRFVSQRELPELGLLSLTMPDEAKRPLLDWRGGKVEGALTGERCEATIWRDTVSLALADEETNDWLSKRLKRRVRLLHFDEESERQTNPRFADAPVALADGYPILVTTQASLDALNARIEESGADAVPMDRFRPNIVIEGADAWAEDGWKRVRVGKLELELVKPCDRCTVTTVAQDRGEVVGEEPLRTLRATRRSADPRVVGVLFGWNAVPGGAGHIAVGEFVEVIERGEPWPIAPSRP